MKIHDPASQAMKKDYDVTDIERADDARNGSGQMTVQHLADEARTRVDHRYR